MNRTDTDERAHEVAGHGEHAGRRYEGRMTKAKRRIAMVAMARLRSAGKNLGAQVDEHVHERPYVVIGAAAGIGFVAGSLFASRLGQVLLAAGAGYVAKNLFEGSVVVETIQEGIERLAREGGGGATRQ